MGHCPPNPPLPCDLEYINIMKTNTMNLYILNDVLYHNDCEGMCVIAAESLTQCERLFMEEFGVEPGSSARWGRINKEVQFDFETAEIAVFPTKDCEAKVVSYTRGKAGSWCSLKTAKRTSLTH